MKIKFSSPFRFVAACARAAFAKIFGYAVLVSPAVQDERLAICDNCEELEDEQCRVCSCYVSAKTALALEECPKKYWQRVWKSRTI